jgi:single-strand DNA-binding protein
MSTDLRMPDLNTIVIAGRLTRDPELKAVGSGSVCKLGIANSRSYKDKSGERKEETVFFDAEIWNAAGEWVAANLTKGRPVLIEGRLKSEEWETQDGSKRQRIKVAAQRVVPLDWPAKDGEAPAPRPAPAPKPAPAPAPGGDDDLPF